MIESAASPINVNSALNIAQRRCDDLGVQLHFDPYAKTACSDGHTITIPQVKQPITQRSLDTLYGFIIHECGHHLRPEAFTILRGAEPPAHVCALYNIIEDDGMERERANEWRGDRKALSTMNRIIVEQVAVSWENAIANGLDVDAQPPEPLAAMGIGRISSLDWDADNEALTMRLLDTLPDAAQQLTADLIKEDWIPRMRAATNAHDTWDITIDLVKRLYPEHDTNAYEEMREAGHKGTEDGEQEERDKTNDPEVGQQSPDSGEGQALQGEMEATDDIGDGEKNGQVVDWQDVVLSEHNQWSESEGVGTLGIDWTGKASEGNVGLMPTGQVNVVDMSTAARKRSRRTDDPYSWSFYEKYMPKDEHNKQFANKVRRYIQAQARSVVDREKYHGKLDRASIVRLALPPIDGGEYNKRIFYDQRKHTMKDTAIFVLTDWSGSMSGYKMSQAADAAQRLVHTFDRVLNVPVALAAFSNKRSECDIGYIKKFTARGTPADEIARRFADFYRWCSANNDADAVNWAYHELLKRKESRKMLIVLSDGCPAGSYGSTSGYDNLKYVTNYIESAGRVELYGIGINSSAVESYYTNVKVLEDAHDINDTLFNIIKDGDNVRRTKNRD